MRKIASRDTKHHRSPASHNATHGSRRIGVVGFVYLVLSVNAYAIVDGEVDVANVYSSVGYTLSLSGALGSVVALDQNWLLTAAHVVDDLPSGPGSFLTVLGNPNPGGAEGIFLFYDSIVLQPGYVVGEFHADLALIRLSDANPIIVDDPLHPSYVDASFATLSNVDLDPSSPDFIPLPGTSTVTGYGLTEVLGAPPTVLLRRHGEGAIYTGNPFVTLMAPPMDPGFPFDCSQAMLLCTYSTGAPPDADASGAPGDSGGAMWLDYGGGAVVGAINSFIFDENDIDPTIPLDWTDGYWTVGTSTAYYADWIRSVVEGGGGTVAFGGAPVPIPPAVYLFVVSLLGVLGISRKRT